MQYDARRDRMPATTKKPAATRRKSATKSAPKSAAATKAAAKPAKPATRPAPKRAAKARARPSSAASAGTAPLTEYRRKRDFKKTAEPKGAKPVPRQTLAFVIQKHAASHLHFDLRLELDGVMKSWAVP
jgi:bifunctional non-homologous end joining protein LigD